MELIGINGFKRSGKDTAFLQLQGILRAWGVDSVKRVAFADKLKIMALLALGYEGDDDALIESANLLKETGFIESQFHAGQSYGWQHQLINGREYLQHFGNHARTVFGDTFWIDQVLPQRYKRALTGMYPGVDYLVVTDVRYPNEAERVRDLGGRVWEIVRPGIDSDGHASETPLPRELVDLTILNDGDVAQLRARISDSLSRVKQNA